MNTGELLTVGILNYNSAEKVKTCLDSVMTYLPDCFVVVWDNASTDNSVTVIQRKFPQVCLRKSSINLWFAEGCNQLVRVCKTPYVLLMNADIRLENRRIIEILSFMQSEDRIVAVSPSINDNGRLRHSAHDLMTPMLIVARDTFLGKVLRRTDWYRCAAYAKVDPNRVFFSRKITNCCCVLRRDAFLSLGGFDASQLLYWTEEAFAWKAASVGYWQAVYGKCSVLHDHGASTSTLAKSFLRAIVVRDRWSYTRRHFGWLSNVLVEILILLRPRFWQIVKDYISYWRHRSRIKENLSVLASVKQEPDEESIPG